MRSEAYFEINSYLRLKNLPNYMYTCEYCVSKSAKAGHFQIYVMSANTVTDNLGINISFVNDGPIDIWKPGPPFTNNMV